MNNVTLTSWLTKASAHASGHEWPAPDAADAVDRAGVDAFWRGWPVHPPAVGVRDNGSW